MVNDEYLLYVDLLIAIAEDQKNEKGFIKYWEIWVKKPCKSLGLYQKHDNLN